MPRLIKTDWANYDEWRGNSGTLNPPCERPEKKQKGQALNETEIFSEAKQQKRKGKNNEL